MPAGELILEYQPIVDLQTGELVGAEALVRWNHPVRGRLGPNVFIPLAEETGLIGEIGSWVLRTACVEVARWANRAPAMVPRVSVNLAASQVADPRLPWLIQSALAQAGASPGWLTLEVTESHLVIDTVAILERLHAIRALGVQISVDDFGTGYSSLAYLGELPIDHIKIDRSFVIPLDDPCRGDGLAAAVVEIGRALNMATIAEGIETELQLDRLRSMGCPLGQGFLLGRPLSADAILERVGQPHVLAGHSCRQPAGRGRLSRNGGPHRAIPVGVGRVRLVADEARACPARTPARQILAFHVRTQPRHVLDARSDRPGGPGSLADNPGRPGQGTIGRIRACDEAI